MNAMSLCNHLQRRGAVYYFRVRIPSDLLEVYAPKREIIHSLKTKDPKEAKAKCRVLAVKVDQEFTAHRRRLEAEKKLAAPKEAPAQRNLTDIVSVQDFELTRLALLYLHEVLSHDEMERAVSKPSEKELREWEETQEHLRQLHEQRGLEFTPEPFPRVGLSPDVVRRKREHARLFIKGGGLCLATGDTSLIQDEALAFLDAHAFKVADLTSPNFQRLCLSLIQKKIEAQEAILKRLDGEWVPTPSPAAPQAQIIVINGAQANPALSSIPGIIQQTVNGPGEDQKLVPSADNPLLSAIWESYLRERKPAPMTERDFEASVNRFIELVGNLPVQAITKSHFRQFKEALLKLPAHLPKEIRRLPFPKLLAKVEQDQKNGTEYKLLNPTTVNNKYLGALKAVLSHAVDGGFIDINPAEQIRVTFHADTQGEAEPSVLPYTDEELGIIFSSSFFVAGHPDKFKKKMTRDQILDYQWLSILGLFTGARLEEIGQLDVADLMKEDGVNYLYVHGDPNSTRRIKNRSSRRKIPVHPRLIELGFLDFVALRASQDEKKIFSTLAELDGRQGKRTSAFSKWWTRLTTEIGVKSGRQKTFHSFRHTFKRAMRNAQVDGNLTDAIQGHSNRSVSAHYGRDKDGMGYALPVLVEAISKARVDGVDVPKPEGR